MRKLYSMRGEDVIKEKIKEYEEIIKEYEEIINNLKNLLTK